MYVEIAANKIDVKVAKNKYIGNYSLTVVSSLTWGEFIRK